MTEKIPFNSAKAVFMRNEIDSQQKPARPPRQSPMETTKSHTITDLYTKTAVKSSTNDISPTTSAEVVVSNAPTSPLIDASSSLPSVLMNRKGSKDEADDSVRTIRKISSDSASLSSSSSKIFAKNGTISKTSSTDSITGGQKFINWVRDRKKTIKDSNTMPNQRSSTIGGPSSTNLTGNSSSMDRRLARGGRSARQFSEKELKQLEDEISTSTFLTILGCEAAKRPTKKNGSLKISLVFKIGVRHQNRLVVIFRDMGHFTKLYSQLEGEFPVIMKEIPLPKVSKTELQQLSAQPLNLQQKVDSVKREMQIP